MDIDIVLNPDQHNFSLRCRSLYDLASVHHSIIIEQLQGSL